MPFHGFLTVWGSSLIGHYLALRLWKEFLLVFCVLGVLYLWIFDHKIRTHTLSRLLVLLILTYIGIELIWGVVAYEGHAVTLKALGYGWIVDLRLPIFFLVSWSVALRLSRLRNRWQWLIAWPAAVVVLFGLLQAFVLPHDFLKHFGYGPNTIPVIETINNNPNYIRIASTLRGADPLGAYLLIPISLFCVQLVSSKRSWRQLILLAASLVVLFYSNSRSAWIGAVISIAIVVFLSIHSQKIRKAIAVSVAGLLVVMAGIFAAFHNNTTFQNYIFHTQHNSTIKTTSDEQHAAAIKNGLNDLVHHPLGSGPGTSGPASYYNKGHPQREPENFYIEIGQEIGWIGLIIFILINVGVGYLLWLRRSDPLALCLLASFVGITFINMLQPAWADDTLAYVWWGLAGLAMTPLPEKLKHGKA